MANPSTTALSPAVRHSPLIDFFERVPFIAGIAVAAIGAVCLAGWVLRLPFVTTPTGSFVVLSITALCFLLGGVSLSLCALPNRTSTIEALQQTLSALVATIAGLTLYEYLRGSGTGFDTLLFGPRLRQLSVAPPGRIAINSAGALLLFGLALVSISHDQRKHDLRSQMFATPGLFIALVAILGHLFGVKGMYSLSQSSGMALPTSIGLLILGVGILVAVRDRGVAVLLLDEGPAGVLTRRLLPAALLAPILLGVIRIVGESAGLYESEFGISLFAVSCILIFVGLVLWSARGRRNTDKERVDLREMEQLARANAERARSEAEIARAEAERANNSKTDFLAVMSHELRTPLTAIMGYEELLSDGITGPVTEEQKQQLGRINASAHHLLGLIDEILTFARVDVGREKIRLDKVSMNTAIAEAAALVEPMASAKSLRFVVVNLFEDQTITTDRTKFKQMLVNLLSNAIKFTDHGEVRLTAAIRGDLAELCVSDTGIGIEPENLEAIFEPFWQVEQGATRRAGGTGLGLS